MTGEAQYTFGNTSHKEQFCRRSAAFLGSFRRCPRQRGTFCWGRALIKVSWEAHFLLGWTCPAQYSHRPSAISRSTAKTPSQDCRRITWKWNRQCCLVENGNVDKFNCRDIWRSARHAVVTRSAPISPDLCHKRNTLEQELNSIKWADLPVATSSSMFKQDCSRETKGIWAKWTFYQTSHCSFLHTQPSSSSVNHCGTHICWWKRTPLPEEVDSWPSDRVCMTAKRVTSGKSTHAGSQWRISRSFQRTFCRMKTKSCSQLTLVVFIAGWWWTDKPVTNPGLYTQIGWCMIVIEYSRLI